MHLATPTPRTKKCITIVSNFSWVLQIEDNTYVTLTFFWGGGGGRGTRCIMVYMKMTNTLPVSPK